MGTGSSARAISGRASSERRASAAKCVAKTRVAPQRTRSSRDASAETRAFVASSFVPAVHLAHGPGRSALHQLARIAQQAREQIQRGRLGDPAQRFRRLLPDERIVGFRRQLDLVEQGVPAAGPQTLSRSRSKSAGSCASFAGAARVPSLLMLVRRESTS